MATKRKAAENAAIAMAEQASQSKRAKSADSSKPDGTKKKVVEVQADPSRIEVLQALHDNANVEDSSEPAQLSPKAGTKRTARGRIDEEEGNATATDDRGSSQNIRAASSGSEATRSSSRKCMKSASTGLASQQVDHNDTPTSVPASPKSLRRASKPRSKAKLVVIETPSDVSGESTRPEASGLTNKLPASVSKKPAEESSRDASSNPPAKGRKPKSSKRSPSLDSSKMYQEEPASQKHPADSVAADESSTSSDSSNDAQVDISGEFAITVLHSARPQVKQVYSTISFQGSPDSKIHSTSVRPFCFGHDSSMQKNIEKTDEQPDPEEEGAVIFRPLKKSFLNVNRLTFYAVTGFQPSSQNKESVLRAGPQQKINSVTGLPMVDPKSRDFVQEFDAAFCAGKRAAEHTEGHDETLSSDSQSFDGDEVNDGPEKAEDSSDDPETGVNTSPQ